MYALLPWWHGWLVFTGLSYFRLLVPLGNIVLKGGSNDSPMELVGPLCSFLDGLLFSSFQQMGKVDATIQTFEELSIGPDAVMV